MLRDNGPSIPDLWPTSTLFSWKFPTGGRLVRQVLKRWRQKIDRVNSDSMVLYCECFVSFRALERVCQSFPDRSFSLSIALVRWSEFRRFWWRLGSFAAKLNCTIYPRDPCWAADSECYSPSYKVALKVLQFSLIGRSLHLLPLPLRLHYYYYYFRCCLIERFLVWDCYRHFRAICWLHQTHLQRVPPRCCFWSQSHYSWHLQ